MVNIQAHLKMYGIDIVLPHERVDVFISGWEKERMTHMSQNIGKGDVVYYVGAEIGDMPAMCQMWGAEVAMFEPSEHYWQGMRRIWESNKLDAPLYFWSGFASNKQHDLNDNVTRWENINMEYDNPKNLGFRELSKEAENFPQIRLDDVNTKAPSVISIDVEGAEFEVLKGAKRILTQYKPKIYLSLHPEFLFDQWGVYGNDVRNYLKGFGYKETLIAYPPHEVHFYYE